MRWYLIQHPFVSLSGSCSLQVHSGLRKGCFLAMQELGILALSCSLLYKQTLEAEASRAFPQTGRWAPMPGWTPEAWQNQRPHTAFCSGGRWVRGAAFWKWALPGPV